MDLWIKQPRSPKGIPSVTAEGLLLRVSTQWCNSSVLLLEEGAATVTQQYSTVQYSTVQHSTVQHSTVTTLRVNTAVPTPL